MLCNLKPPSISGQMLNYGTPSALHSHPAAHQHLMHHSHGYRDQNAKMQSPPGMLPSHLPAAGMKTMKKSTKRPSGLFFDHFCHSCLATAEIRRKEAGNQGGILHNEAETTLQKQFSFSISQFEDMKIASFTFFSTQGLGLGFFECVFKAKTLEVTQEPGQRSCLQALGGCVCVMDR